MRINASLPLAVAGVRAILHAPRSTVTSSTCCRGDLRTARDYGMSHKSRKSLESQVSDTPSNKCASCRAGARRSSTGSAKDRKSASSVGAVPTVHWLFESHNFRS